MGAVDYADPVNDIDGRRVLLGRCVPQDNDRPHRYQAIAVPKQKLDLVRLLTNVLSDGPFFREPRFGSPFGLHDQQAAGTDSQMVDLAGQESVVDVAPALFAGVPKSPAVQASPMRPIHLGAAPLNTTTVPAASQGPIETMTPARNQRTDPWTHKRATQNASGSMARVNR